MQPGERDNQPTEDCTPGSGTVGRTAPMSAEARYAEFLNDHSDGLDFSDERLDATPTSGGGIPWSVMRAIGGLLYKRS